MATVSLDRTPLVKLTFRGYVGLMRLLGGGKHSKMPLLPAKGNVRHPLVRDVVPISAEQAGRLVVAPSPPSVLAVDGLSYVSQLANSIVSGFAVDVVNLPGGPNAMHIQPCKAMRSIAPAVNHDDRVAVCDTASTPSWLCRPSSKNAPSKYASFGVVVKKLAQALRGKIGLSHDAPVKRIGQRPVSVSSTCGLRYFSVGGA